MTSSAGIGLGEIRERCQWSQGKMLVVPGKDAVGPRKMLVRYLFLRMLSLGLWSQPQTSSCSQKLVSGRGFSELNVQMFPLTHAKTHSVEGRLLCLPRPWLCCLL